jgi:hypothetical protein
LTTRQRKAAAAVLQSKCAVYADGCLKRGRLAEAAAVANLPKKYSSST